MSHLTKSFDDFKIDTRDFHKEQRLQWEKFGGEIQGFASIKAEVLMLTQWMAEVAPTLKLIIQDRQDNRKRLWDVAWKWGQLFIQAVFFALMAWYISRNTVIKEVSNLSNFVVEEVK